MFPRNQDGSQIPSFWPFTQIGSLIPEWADEKKQLNDLSSAFRMDVCRDGTLSVRERGQKPFNGVALPCVYWNDLKTLQSYQHLVSIVHYESDDRLVLEEGTRYMFSWGVTVGTLWQVDAVAAVLAPMILRHDLTEGSERAGQLTAEIRRVAEEEQIDLRGWRWNSYRAWASSD